MSGLAKRIDDWGDRLNPIVVKELRQAAEGRFAMILLLSLIALQVLIVGGALLSQVGSGADVTAAGSSTFGFLSALLVTSCALLIPLYVGFRLSSERSGEDMDLIYVTTISPREIVSGKAQASMALTLLVVTTFLPFLALTYFLRGIDLLSIFVSTAFTVLLVTVLSMAAILVGCLPLGRAVKIILGLAALFFLLPFSSTMIFMIPYMAAMGLQQAVWRRDFWVAAAPVAVGLVVGCVLLQQLSVALLTPSSANRALPARRTLTILWLATGLLAVWGSHATASREPLYMWCVVFTLVSCAGYFIAVSERQKPGPRLSRQIPRHEGKRALAFLFYSGAAGGLLWTILVGGGTLLVTRLASRGAPWPSLEFVGSWAIFQLYCLAYALLGVLIWRWLLRRRMPSKYIGLLGLGILALASFLPLTIGALLMPEYWSTTTGFRNWLLGNPFAIGIDSHRHVYLMFAFVLAAGAFLGCLDWLRVQMMAFRPPPPARPAPATAREEALDG